MKQTDTLLGRHKRLHALQSIVETMRLYYVMPGQGEDATRHTEKELLWKLKYLMFSTEI
jgi:hypothetical protein